MNRGRVYPFGGDRVRGTSVGTMFEAFEARQMLAHLVWDGGGDGRSWMDPANWSSDAIPGAADTVLIPAVGQASGAEPEGALRLVLDGIREPVAAIRAERGVRLMGGALGVSGAAEFGRGLDVDATATLRAAAVSARGAIEGYSNINGVIRATRVEIDAGRDAVLVIRGQVDVSSEAGRGGWAQLLGWQVVMLGATVDARGETGGGTVLIGGEEAGDESLPRAEAVYLNGATSIRADAREVGDGGRVVVWGNEFTGFFGTISARGGRGGGNGGFVETSAKDKLQVAGGVDAAAPAGIAGVWLLDPRNISITAGGNDNVTFGGVNPVIVTATTTSGFVAVSFINSSLNAGTSVTIRTTGTGLVVGNITLAVGAAISKTGGASCTLRLEATNDIILNSTITDTSGGVLNVFLDANDQIQGGDLSTGIGSVTINSPINTGGGQLTIRGIGATIGANLTVTGGLTIDVGGGGVALTGVVNVGGENISLTSAGTVTQSAPSTIAAGGLRLAGTGAITLFQSNAIGTIAASMTGAGSFTVGVSGAMSVGTVLGTVGVTTAGGNAVFGTGTGALSVTQPVNVGAGVFAGELGAGIAVSGSGSISAGGIGILSGVAISLTSNVSASTIALQTVGGASIAYSQAGSFTIGPVLGASGISSANGNVTLSSGGSISIIRALNAGAGTVSITSGTGISQTTSGSITAAGLALSGAGTANLDDASNNVGTLAAATTGSGQVIYFDADALTVGTVAGVVGVSTQSDPVQLASGGVMSIISPVTSGSATMVLLATDLAISATVTCNGNLFIDLVNGMGSFGLGSGGGLFSLSDAELGLINAEILNIGGVTSFVPISTSALNLTSRPFTLRLSGSTISTLGITMNPTRALLLNANTISQTGAIIASDLVVQVSSTTTLSHPANDVDRLGFSAVATFTFSDVDGFQVGSQGTGGSLGEFSTANLNAGGGVVLASTISASAGSSLTINAPGGVTSTGGVITVSTVNITGGAVNLPGNNDADVLTFALSGAASFTWTDTNDLTLNASSTSGGAVNLTVPVLSILGQLSASGAVVTLDCATDCDTVESGRVTSSSLLVRGGNVDQTFTLATTITTFASDAAAAIVLSETSSLVIGTVGGIVGVTLPNRDLTLNVGGSLSILSPISLGSGDLLLAVGGTTTQDVGGPVSCDLLSITGGGAATLGNTGNAVARLQATGAGAVTLVNAIGLQVGGVGGVVSAASLSVQSTGDVTVSASIASGGAISILAGTDGTGNLLVNGGLFMNASAILVRAGDGAAGSNTGAVTMTGVTLRGVAGAATSPTSFTLRQDASIADAGLLLATQFAGGLVGLPLSYQSDAGGITLATASKVAGAAVTLASATGTLLNTSISPGSLNVSGPATSAGGSVNATGNVTFGGALTLNVSTTIAGVDLALASINGNTPLLRALTLNGSGATVVSGSIGATAALASVVTSAGGTLSLGGSVFTASEQTYNEATVNITGAATLSGGDISFAPLSAISLGASSLVVRANELVLGGTMTGTGSLTIEAASAAQGVTIGASSAANLDLTAAELGRIGATLASVTIGRADGTGQIVIAGPSTFTNPTTLRAPLAGGSILVSSPLTGSGDASFTFVGSGATTTLSADVRTAGAPITFNDSVVVAAANVTVDTTNNGAVPAGANITFNFAVNGQAADTNNLTLTAGGGEVRLNAAVGTTVPLRTLVVSGLARVAASPIITTTGQTYQGQVVLAGAAGSVTTFSTGGTGTFGSAINALAAGQQGLNVIGHAVFNGPIGGGAALASVAVTRTTQIGTTSIATSAGAGGTGLQTYAEGVTLTTAADTVVTFSGGGGGVVFGGTVNATAAGEQGLSIVGAFVTFSGHVGDVVPLRSLTSGIVRFNGNLNLSSGGGGSGDLLASGLVTLGGASGTVHTLATAGGTIRLNAGLQPLAAGQQGLDVAGNLVLGSAGITTALRQLGVSGTAALSGGAVRTSSAAGGSGGQTFAGGVTLTAGTLFEASGPVVFGATLGAGSGASTIRGQSVAFGATVSGTGALTIEPNDPVAGMLIGGSDGPGGAFDLPAASISQLANGFASIVLGRVDTSGLVSIAAPVSFNDPVTFRAPAGAGRVQVNGLLTGLGDATLAFQSAQPVILNAGVRTTGQAITFGGSVLIGAASVTVDSTNAGAAGAGAAVTFSGAVNSEPGETNALSVLGGSGGATAFAQPVGASQPLSNLSTDAGGTLTMVGATTTGSQVFADGAATVSGVLATSNAGVTFSGAVALSGATTISTGSGPINFGGSVNGPHALALSSTGGVSLSAAVGSLSPLASFVSSAGGTLLASTIQASGAVQLLDAIITLNSGILSSSGGVISTVPTSAIRLGGSTTIASPAGQPAVLAASIDGLIPGAGSLLLTGPAAITGQIGAQVAPGAFRATGATTVASASIISTSAGGGTGRVTFDLAPAFSGAVTLVAPGLGVELPAGFTASTGTVSLLGQLALGGPANVTAGLVEVVLGAATTGGAITLGNSGAPSGVHVDAAEIARFADGFSRLVFGRADGSGNVIVASPLTFTDPVLLRAPVAPGQILVNAAITALAGVEFQGSGATVVLNADVRTAGSPITFNDGVLVAASVVVDTTNNGAVGAGAAITFGPGFQVNSETGEANNLTLRGGTTGVTTLGGDVGMAAGGALGALSTDAGGATVIGGSVVNVVNAALFGDGVTFAASSTVAASLGVVTFASTFAGGVFDTRLAGSEIDFLGAVSGTGRIRLEPNVAGRNLNVAHATEGGSDALDITKSELDLFAPGFEMIEIGKDDGSGVLDFEEYAFDSSTLLQMPGVGGSIVVNGELACDTDGGSIGIRGTGSTTHLRAPISTRGGAITIDDSIVIDTDGVFISTRRAERAGAPVTITGIVNSVALARRDLTIQSGIGAISILGEVGGRTNGELGQLTLNGGGGINLFGPRIRTRGAQNYNGPVALGPAVTLQNVGSPINFNGTLNGAGNLTIAPGSGATTFNGDVGGVTRLNALLINTGSTRIFNAPVSVGVLTVFGGNVEFNALTAVETGLLIAGTLGGSGDVTFTLPLTWVGGNMVGTGTTRIALSGSLVISGGPKTLSRAIVNDGAIYWTDGDLNFAGGSLVNQRPGQFFAQSDGQFIGVSGSNSIENRGLIERSGAGASAFTGITVTNPGDLTILSGNLAITPAGGTFVDAGTTTIGAGSALLITGNYTQAALGRLNTTLASEAAFGRVTVTGTASLAGVLGVTLDAGFPVPAPGTRFDVVTGAARVGQFSATFLPSIPGRILDAQYGDTFAAIVVRSGADYNGDGNIDPDDLADFIAGFFGTPPDIRTDFNGDGVVDPDDLADFIAAFFGG